MQKSAKDIEDYYFNNYGSQVFAMIGMSMSAAIIWNNAGYIRTGEYQHLGWTGYNMAKYRLGA